MRKLYLYSLNGLIGFITCVFFGILSIGCQTTKPFTIRCYPGPVLQGENISIIYIADELHLLEIDGAKTSMSVRYAHRNGYRLEMPPGDHTIVVYYYNFTSRNFRGGNNIKGNPLCVFFRTESGGIYRLTHSYLWYSDGFDSEINLKELVSGESILVTYFPQENGEKTH